MIPALQFNARRQKATVWRQWVASIPKARKEKQARDHDRHNVEGSFAGVFASSDMYVIDFFFNYTERVMKKWLSAYRARMNTKAVA